MQRRTGAVPAADDELNDGVCQQPGQGRGNLRLDLVADRLGEGGAEVFAAFECAAQRVGQAAADVVDRLFPGAGGVFGGLDASLSRRLLVEQLRQFAARFDLALDGGVGVRAFGRARELFVQARDGDLLDGASQAGVGGCCQLLRGLFVLQALDAGLDRIQRGLTLTFELVEVVVDALVFGRAGTCARLGGFLRCLVLALCGFSRSGRRHGLRDQGADVVLLLDGELADGLGQSGIELDLELLGLAELAAGFSSKAAERDGFCDLCRQAGKGIAAGLGRLGVLLADGRLFCRHLGRRPRRQAFGFARRVEGSQVAAVFGQRIRQLLAVGFAGFAPLVQCSSSLDVFLNSKFRRALLQAGFCTVEQTAIDSCPFGVEFIRGRAKDQELLLPSLRQQFELILDTLERFNGGFCPEQANKAIPCFCRLIFRVSPRGGKRAQLRFQFFRPPDRLVCISVLRKPRSLSASSLFFQCADLVIQADGQEFCRLIQLQGALGRVAAQFRKRLYRFLNRRTAFTLKPDRRFGEFLKITCCDAPSGRKLRDNPCCLALRAYAGADLRGNGRQLQRRCTDRVAGQNDRLAELKIFFRRLRIGKTERGDSRRTGRKCQHSRRDQRCQGFQCVAHAAEAVLDLPALLDQHQKRVLSTGQAGEDVRELCGQLLHRHAQLVRADTGIAGAARIDAKGLLLRPQGGDVRCGLCAQSAFCCLQFE